MRALPAQIAHRASMTLRATFLDQTFGSVQPCAVPVTLALFPKVPPAAPVSSRWQPFSVANLAEVLTSSRRLACCRPVVANSLLRGRELTMGARTAQPRAIRTLPTNALVA
jgi:hypothetical protein